MMWIVRLALRRPYTFVVFALLILILGVYSIMSMPTDIFPNIDIPVVTVVWNYTGLSAEEMSNRIVFNSERGMTTTVSDIEHIESQSLNGVGSHQDLLPAAREHRQRGGAGDLDLPGSACASFRRATTPPFIIQYNASSVPVLMLGLVRNGLERAAAVRSRPEHHPHPTGHRRRRADALSLWRQAAPDPGGYRSRRAAGQRICRRPTW